MNRKPQLSSSSQDSTRVLLFIQTLNLGGSETQCVELARQLAREGYSVTVGCLRAGGPLERRLREAAIEVVEFPIHTSLLRPNTLVQMLKLVAFIRARRFRVVHTNDLYSNLFAVPPAWLARVPVIISSRRDLSRWWWYTPFRRKILCRIQQLSTKILVNSEAVRRDLLLRDGFRPGRICVVYNGIDAEKYGQAGPGRVRLLPAVSESAKWIVMIGNMHTGVKGHGDLIEAAKTIRERHPEARFLLAGDGEMRSFFENQVQAAGLQEMFVFLGHRTDIPALLSCCDIGVLASRSEGLPNAVLECMAAGLPVVATTVGGVPEIIQNEINGLLVPPENPSALAEALLRLLDEESLRKQLGKAGRQRVLAEFAFSGVLESLRGLYDEPQRAVASASRVAVHALHQIKDSQENV